MGFNSGFKGLMSGTTALLPLCAFMMWTETTELYVLWDPYKWVFQEAIVCLVTKGFIASFITVL